MSPFMLEYVSMLLTTQILIVLRILYNQQLFGANLTQVATAWEKNTTKISQTVFTNWIRSLKKQIQQLNIRPLIYYISCMELQWTLHVKMNRIVYCSWNWYDVMMYKEWINMLVCPGSKHSNSVGARDRPLTAHYRFLVCGLKIYQYTNGHVWFMSKVNLNFNTPNVCTCILKHLLHPFVDAPMPIWLTTWVVICLPP